jgi:hypothetical protein
MQDITRKTVRPSDSEEHVKFRSIQADEYKIDQSLMFLSAAFRPIPSTPLYIDPTRGNGSATYEKPDHF